ncbi:hypothetical protein [Paenarthrobacter sp. NPDC018779]|uniref:hypothetical protein n=1 Tax=Paenarthrobacter sp. NPDC018779 TaxID=3364375 RepID=UPI0037C5856E
MTDPLGSDGRQVLERASRSQVIASVGRIQVSSNGDWLPPTNVYAANAGERIRQDNRSVPESTEVQFADYLASSAFIHSGDAWSYFGGAINSLMRGDVSTSVHLAYYAELRAAISLLASEGIVIGNGANFVLDQNGHVIQVTRAGTHDAAWQYLEAWNQGDRSAELLGEVLRPGNIPLLTWADEMPSGGIRPVIVSLLDQMKFDLQHFAEDRTRRNAASYHPTRLRVDDFSAADSCRLVSELWGLVEPDGQGSFRVMDDEILFTLLVKSYVGTTGNKAHGDAWMKWLEASMPSSQLGGALHSRLKGGEHNEGASLLGALFHGNTVSGLPSEYVASMMVRTLVLMRFATGSANLLLRESGLKRAQISPWLEALAESRGLWAPGENPADVSDLWIDAQEALDSLVTIPKDNTHTLLKAANAELLTLGQAERVLVWSC